MTGQQLLMEETADPGEITDLSKVIDNFLSLVCLMGVLNLGAPAMEGHSKQSLRNAVERSAIGADHLHNVYVCGLACEGLTRTTRSASVFPWAP